MTQPGDRVEVAVDGFVIDVVRGETLLEVQTRHLYAMKRKLARLLPQYPVCVIHPIAQEKWIVRQTAVGDPISRRKSPKHGRPADLFQELVRLTEWLPHPNLTIELLLTQEEAIWRDDGLGSWRRKHWSLYDHRLLAVVDRLVLAETADFLALLPPNLPDPFTNRQLAEALSCQPALAQKITYTLRHIQALTAVGKEGHSHLYTTNSRR
ncbi:MAG: hypothetical protein IPM39_05290 [Chloroflexi bacterium]|nr:hypothetical protein [Chloroflexota bacterium]